MFGTDRNYSFKTQTCVFQCSELILHIDQVSCNLVVLINYMKRFFFEVLYIGPSNINLLLSNIKVLFFSTYMST